MPSPDNNFDKLRKLALAECEHLYDGARPVIMVGTATCGKAAGAEDVLHSIQEELAGNGVDARVVEVGCMGHCYAEPLVIISKPGHPSMAYGYVTPEVGRRLVRDYLVGEDPSLEFTLGALEENDLIPTIYDLPRFTYEKHLILANCGHIDPENIHHYIARGGYEGLHKALQMQPEEIVKCIRESELRGRGGAGFPAWKKWDVARNAPDRPRYVICNADEGDPGAFMDRAILESDPHSVLEGMVIAAYTVGARRGYIYIRSEYPLAVHRVQAALRQARSLGLLGREILGSKYSFYIKVIQGSGAFVCGEETALIASLEGKAGLPKHRPPFPAVSGLNGKPTLINNVK
ncbi:MAG: NADH-quinone oxidoreductase subunit F, partial [Dehalococcoidia bacterium]|nr:NADH-quinone oxidoreductase subunit F [Dehalococcoidia bacterium]